MSMDKAVKVENGTWKRLNWRKEPGDRFTDVIDRVLDENDQLREENERLKAALDEATE
jgi:regulator of replication initiation timing